MGRFIQYSGSILVLGVLLLVIYRAAIEQGFISRNFLKNPKVAVFLEISKFVLIIQSAVLMVGFTIYNAVHGKMNFFELEKIWLRGDAQIMTDRAAALLAPGNGPSQGLLTFYPLLLKLTGTFFKDFYFLAGSVLSGLALITAGYFLYQLTVIDYDEKVARESVKFLLFFPFSFCLFFPVPESLFLALSIAAFYYMRKQDWVTVAVCSGLAVLLDLRGILLSLPIVYEFFQQDQKKWRLALPLGSIVLGGLAVLALNLWQNGNPLAFLNHHSTNFNFINNHTWNTDYRVFFGNVLPLAVLITVILIGGFLALGKIRPSYLLYAVPLAAAAFFIPWLDNQPRFFTVVFPLFIGLAVITKNRTANMISLFLLTVFMGFYLFCYIFFKMAY